jgi:TP901 family phage tail tape measure protein
MDTTPGLQLESLLVKILVDYQDLNKVDKIIGGITDTIVGHLQKVEKAAQSANKALQSVNGPVEKAAKSLSGNFPAAVPGIDKTSKAIDKATASLKALAKASNLPLVPFFEREGEALKGFSGVVRFNKTLVPLLDVGPKTSSSAGTSFPSARNLFPEGISFGSLARGGPTPDVLERLRRIAELTNKVVIDTKKWSLDFEKIGKSISNIHDGVRSASVEISRFGRSLSILSTPAASAVGFGIFQFAGFDDELTRVLTHLQDWGQSNRPLLENGLLGMSGGGIYGTRELTKALDVLVMSGQSAGMAMKSLDIAQRFATAGNIELTDATRKLVDIQFKLGLASTDAEKHYANMTRLSDLLVGTAAQTGTTVEQLADSFGSRLGIQIQKANIPLEDVISLLGILNERGLKGAEAGDALSLALLQIEQVGVSRKSKLDVLGAQFYDLQGSLKPTGALLEILSEQFGTASLGANTAREAIAGFESRTKRSIEGLVGMQTAFLSLRKEMELFDGITLKTSQMIEGTLLSQFKNLWSNAQNAALIIGKQLAPYVAYLNDKLISLLKQFAQLNPVVQRVIAVTLVLTAAIGPLLLATGFLGTNFIVPMMAFFGFLASNFPLILGFLGTMVAWLPALGVLGAVVAGLIYLLSDSTVLQDFLKNGLDFGRSLSWKGFLGDASTALTALTGFFYNLQENVGTVFGWLKDNWSSILVDMSVAAGVFSANMVDNWARIVSYLWKSIVDFEAWLVTNLPNILGSAFDLLTKGLIPVLATMAGLFGIFIESMILRLKEAMNELIRSVNPKIPGKDIEELPIHRLTNFDLMRQTPEYKARYSKLESQGNDAIKARDRIRDQIEIAKGNYKDDERWLTAQLNVDLYQEAIFGLTERMVGGPRRELSTGEIIATKAKSSSVEMAAAIKENFKDFTLPDFGLPGLRKTMSGNFDAMMKGIVSPLEGFKAITPGFNLNLGLPGAIGGALGEFMKREFKPQLDQKAKPLDMVGPGGPGYALKEISERRFVIGGPVAQSLDLQQLQTLRFMASDVANILAAIRDYRPDPVTAK